MIFTVLGAVTELERSLIGQRVRAGLRKLGRKGSGLDDHLLLLTRRRFGNYDRPGNRMSRLERLSESVVPAHGARYNQRRKAEACRRRGNSGRSVAEAWIPPTKRVVMCVTMTPYSTLSAIPAIAPRTMRQRLRQLW